MGWRLIKGWSSPGRFFPAQELSMVNRLGLYIPLCSEGRNSCHHFSPDFMHKNPEWFEYTPDLPEGWVRPEDTNAEYGWLLMSTGAIHVFQKAQRENAYFTPGFTTPILKYQIKAIYPLTEPKI